MTFRRPTDAELRGLASELGLSADGEEAALLGQMVAGALGAYARLEAEPDLLPAAPGARRWWRPTAQDDPLRAWTARSAIREREHGPLAGYRVAVKDNAMVAGLPMCNGSATLEDYVAELDASVVRRLLDAGAEIAGKARCESFCLSAGSHTGAGGPVHNPHRRGHTSGGSSSGSAAAVAAGDVELAVACDQGGSIRLPAAFCGVVGMKPTWGLVPYTGIAPIEPTLDHVGPISANVRDNALMLEVMAGPDGIDPRQGGAPSQPWSRAVEEGVRSLRVALLAEGFGHAESMPEVDDAVREAAGVLEKLGARVETVSVPLHRAAGTLTLPLLAEGMYHTLLAGDGMGTGREDLYVPSYLAAQRRWRVRGDALGPLVKVLALLGAWIDRSHGPRFYGKAVHQARRLRAAYDAALAEVDLLLLPTSPITAPPLPPADAGLAESLAAASLGVANTQPFDASHHPALSVPCGSVDGLPVGMMLVGRQLDEATLYRAAGAFEQAVDWRRQ
jgi:amidase